LSLLGVWSKCVQVIFPTIEFRQGEFCLQESRVGPLFDNSDEALTFAQCMQLLPLLKSLSIKDNHIFLQWYKSSEKVEAKQRSLL
jgi:hypothetical protein